MKKNILILLAIMFVFSYCKKVDNVSPVISSVNINMNDTLQNKFTIKVEATDNKSISKIEYYANDSLLAEVTQLPFDYQWNTLEIKDGPYSIKIVVYDKEGNKTEDTKSVLVQNVLLSLNMGDLYKVPYHIVISDEMGNILNSDTFTSKDTKKINPLLPFEGKAINVVYFYKPYDITYFYAFVHVKRGSEFKLGFGEPGPPDKGFQLHIKNDVGYFTEINASTNRTWYSLRSMTDTTYLARSIPYTTSHKLLMQLNTSSGRFYKFFTVENTDDLTVALSSIDKLQSMKTYTFPGAGFAMYTLSGRINNEDGFYDCFINVGQNAYNTYNLTLYYPNEYFSLYMTSILWNRTNFNNKSYQNIYVGDIPSTYSKIDADAEVISQSPGNFSANFSGVFDYYDTFYSSIGVSLNVYAPSGQNKWVLPDISKVFDISDINFNSLVLRQVLLTDFESVNWANKYYDPNTDIKHLQYTDRYQRSLILQVNGYKKLNLDIDKFMVNQPDSIN